MESFSFPLTVGNQAALFLTQRNAAFLSQPKGTRPFCNPIDTDTLTELIKVNVAGLHDRLVEINVAVPLSFPIPEYAVAKGKIARIKDLAVWLHYPFFQAGDRHNDLESRSGRVLPLNGSVAEGMQPIFYERAPFFGINATGEAVRVKGRRADHRKNRPRADI